MASNPRFVKPGKLIRVRNNAVANTDSSGATAPTIFKKEDGTDWTAGADGALLEKVLFMNSQIVPAASSAMVIRIFVSDALGTTWTPIPDGEAELAAKTRSATAGGAKGEIYFGGYPIDAGCKLGFAQSAYVGVADVMSAMAIVKDFTAE